MQSFQKLPALHTAIRRLHSIYNSSESRFHGFGGVNIGWRGKLTAQTSRKQMSRTGTIATATLRELASTGAIANVRLVGEADGFALLVRCGLTEKALLAKRGHVRHFKSLESAVSFVRDLGLARVEVDLTRWERRQRSLR